MSLEKTAKAIKIAMIQAELNPQQLADVLGKNVSTVSRWRSHGCNSLTQLQEIARACGMSYEELMELG